MKRAVELMPNDPIVNDHYGDILWKLNRKIQARYFWTNILEMDDAIGQIMQTLKEEGLEDNTLVYFTSDHGSHIDLGSSGGTNGPFKGTLYSLHNFAKASS